MVDTLLTILDKFGYPVIRQGSMNDEDAYPESFFTFWNDDSSDHSHYDNSNYGITWEFDINFYSIDPALTYSVLSEARVALKEAGWIISGEGHDVASDEPTHTGRGISITYLQT